MGLLGRSSTFNGVDVDNPIKKASQSIADAISGFGDQLVNPMTNVSQAETGVALVDENSSSVNASLTNYKSFTLEGIMARSRDLVGGILNNPDLGRVLTWEDGFNVDTDELFRIAAQGLGFSLNGMGDIKRSIGDSFLESLNDMTGGLSSGLYFDDQMKLKIGDGWQMDVADEFLGFVSKMDSDFGKVLNLAGVNAVLNTMVNQAAMNSMYQTYDSFADQYLFYSDYVDALINSLEFILGRGDLESMNKIFEIIEEEGIQKVRAQYPDFIERALANFYFTSDVYPEDYEEMAIMLDKVLVLYGGEDWFYSHTEFGKLVNLAVVSNISEDAKLLLGDFEKYHVLLLGAGIYQDESAYDVFLRQIPNAIDFQMRT
ncbi:hypothetical protein PQC07_gp043 [Aeromonas phage D3]|uniref:Uncharacterized protein n=3 Tax=Ludhianavirus TaxID=3044751 RepID=A0A514A1A9_9CAUD|nr:hypothetical protein PQC06_gp146 [Aeromonas phage LAh10]YP_010668713.1 hypothetical protein PQC07_gp043 [Aeromonas phage D3]YP_010668980.1 hypothetical protein PQC08_gp043 [Aeromonas phage D6]QEP52268.1 hypothetical protein D9_0061 [Aeromonas phage D9]QDH47069.1 hypothetical protein LAh10_146 [Aeromonas phage LAh10]QDJ96962.1 hypothetical protein D3_0232 [Aeromonas phage D3]QDJ97391.1 hypothetical protein D6_0232 [Aeromonas phage D6]